MFRNPWKAGYFHFSQCTDTLVNDLGMAWRKIYSKYLWHCCRVLSPGVPFFLSNPELQICELIRSGNWRSCDSQLWELKLYFCCFGRPAIYLILRVNYHQRFFSVKNSDCHSGISLSPLKLWSPSQWQHFPLSSLGYLEVFKVAVAASLMHFSVL